jgi:hypothetical protein
MFSFVKMLLKIFRVESAVRPCGKVCPGAASGTSLRLSSSVAGSCPIFPSWQATESKFSGLVVLGRQVISVPTISEGLEEYASHQTPIAGRSSLMGWRAGQA